MNMEENMYQKFKKYLNLYCNVQNIAEMEFLVPSLEDGNYDEY